MKTYKVIVAWKGRKFAEDYECTENGIVMIVKEFKQMKDRPWSVKVAEVK